MSVKNVGELIDILSEFDRESKVIISAEFSNDLYFEFHGQEFPAGGIFNFGWEPGFVEIFLGCKFKINDHRKERESEEMQVSNHRDQHTHPGEPLGGCQKMENDMHLKLIDALGKSLLELEGRVSKLEIYQAASAERIETLLSSIERKISGPSVFEIDC